LISDLPIVFYKNYHENLAHCLSTVVLYLQFLDMLHQYVPQNLINSSVARDQASLKVTL